MRHIFNGAMFNGNIRTTMQPDYNQKKPTAKCVN